MPVYNCINCNYSTKIINHYNRHLTTSKHMNNLNLQKELCSKTIKFSQIPQLPSQIPLNHSQIPLNHSQIPLNHSQNIKINNIIDESLNNKLICEYCSIKFTRIDNLNRHIKKSCKEKKKYDKIKAEERKQIIKLEDEKKDMNKQINELIQKVGTTNNYNNKLDMSTSTNTNTNTSISTSTNIKLNNYGEENLSMLTDSFMRNMIQLPFGAIPKKIERIHFNNKYPENKNIRLLNKNDNKIQVLKDNKWTYVKKRDTIQRLIDDKNYLLDEYFEDNIGNFDEKFQRRFEKFREKVDELDKLLLRDLHEDIELILLNNK